MKKLKGFTLLELIIVMAIFSIIMYSAVQLLNPVSKFFVRSSNFENTTACTDNMRRCIEGNLKYADRVRAYNKYQPYTGNPSTPSADLLLKVQSFYTQFFKDRRFIDSSGVINVLVFDNTVLQADISGMNQISEYTGAELNRGKIILYRFEFDNYDGDDETTVINNMLTPTIWCVNQKLYGNFDYTFTLNDPSVISESIISANADPFVTTGSDETTRMVYSGTDVNGSDVYTPYVPVVFNPRDFNIGIAVQEIRRVPGGGLERATPTTSIVASFSMKNVLNSSDGYKTAGVDYVPTLGYGDEHGDHAYQVNPKRAQGQMIPRYTGIDENIGTDLFDGFYFIFTLPEEVHDVADGAHYDDAFLNRQVTMPTGSSSSSSSST